ncbi:transposable element Tcb2 transposase, partial [Trichonephila clavipes]
QERTQRGSRNETTQLVSKNETTYLVSRNETTQLCSRNETTQLCTAVDHLQPPLQQNRLFLPISIHAALIALQGGVRQLGRSDCVARGCLDQWIREVSFTRRLGSGRPRQTSRREDHHTVRNARVQLTASSAVIQALVTPLLWAPVSSRTIQRRPAEEHLGSRRPLRVLPLTPTRKLDCNGMETGDL